jgi:hypothetical protein
MPPLVPTSSDRGAIPSPHDASPTHDVRGAQQGKPAASGSHRGAIRGSHVATPHSPQTNPVRGGRTQDPGGWGKPAKVTAGRAAAPHSRPAPVVPTKHLVAEHLEHLTKAGVVHAHNGKPHGHSAPDAHQQPAPASAKHHDAKSDANKPTTQPGRQTVSPSAVRADQAKSNTHSSAPVPATVTVTTFKSWLLTFERPVSDDEVARWLFPTGNVPEGFVIRVHGNGSNPSQQWDVSYGDWKGDPKGDSIARMAQFRDLFTPYGLDLVDRAWLGGEPTPQEAAEIKASDEKKARENAIRNDRIIPALNMSDSEALKRMQPGAYELNGNFVWIGYKTSGRKDVREELQIVEKSATNPVFNNDIRFYLRHGLDLNDAILAFNEQWDEIFNIELAFAGTGAGYRVRDPASSAAARDAGAAGYAGLESRLALNRVMSAVEKPESVVIVTEIAEDAGKLAARAKPDYRLNGPVTLSKPKTTGGGTPVVPPTPYRPKPAPVDWLHGIDPGPTLEREGPATSGGSSASALGPGRSPAAGGRTRPVNPNRQMAVGNDGPPQEPKAPATPDVPAAATHDTNGPQPEIRGDVKGGGVVLGEKNVVSGTIGSNTSNNDTGTLNLSENGFRDLKARRPVSGIVTSGQGQRVVRFRYDGERLTASVIAADHPSLAREFVTFRRQSIDLGKELGAKVVRLQGEMVGEEVAAFLQENNFERVPGMDGILRLDIPIK